jgi:hypothetical protein
MRYIVTDKNRNRVNLGTSITDFRGDTKVFHAVTRGPEYNGTAKIAYTAHSRGISNPRECYANVFDLTVVNIPESVTEAEQRIATIEESYKGFSTPPPFIAELLRMRRFIADPEKFLAEVDAA